MQDKDSVEDKDIVNDHRNMLMVSKNISKFQENNLKSWSFICFDSVDKAEVEWDFIKNNPSKDFYPGKVVFNIHLKEKNDNQQERIDKIVACTKFLFWKETEVVVNLTVEDEQ